MFAIPVAAVVSLFTLHVGRGMAAASATSHQSNLNSSTFWSVCPLFFLGLQFATRIEFVQLAKLCSLVLGLRSLSSRSPTHLHASQHRPTHKQAMEEIQPQAPARPAWMTDSVDALLSFCNQKTPGDNEKDGVGSEGLRGVERLRDTRLAWFHIPQLTHPHPPLMFRGLGMMRMSLMRLPQACTTRERTR